MKAVNYEAKFKKLKKEHTELINGIKEVFDKYFEDGKNYDPDYSPADALNDIYSWID